MEIDQFGISHLSRLLMMNIPVEALGYITGFTLIYKPSNPEILSQYYITVIERKDGTVFCIFHYDKNKHKLKDVEKMYEDLDRYSRDSYIALHNYCCRRLREEIQTITGLGLCKIGKSLK